MARNVDSDDLRSVTFGLQNPCRLVILDVPGYRVHMDEIHAFIWLSSKYHEAGRKRMAKHAAYAIRKNTMRLLGVWLQSARFEKGAIH